MEPIAIRIKDELRHPHYDWPLSPITETVTTDFDPRKALLLDENSAEVPFQIVELTENGGYTATICFLREVPCGADEVLRLVPCKDAAEACAANPLCGKHLRVRLCGEGFEVCLPSGAIGRATVPGAAFIKAENVRTGSVFNDVALSYTLANGVAYTLSLRVWHDLPFMELDEALSAEADGGGVLRIEWDNYAPRYRFCRDRGKTEVDAYLRDDGMIPWTVKPYASAVNWWAGHQMSFFAPEEAFNIGIFALRTAQWKTDAYQIWEAGEETAVRFYVRGRKLVWEYPLAGRSRATALAVYPHMDETVWEQSVISGLRLWYESIPFDKVRRWTLRWDEPQDAYPRHFKPEGIQKCGYHMWHYGRRFKPAEPEEMQSIIYKQSHMMNSIYTLHPVPIREMVHWLHTFDHSAPKMERVLYDDIRACIAFMAYVTADESVMPMENILGGHPNFLSDARHAAALAASLFPSHPDAGLWLAQFERTVRRNMKYHIRPAVKAWGAQAGRWTENLGCYNNASLIPMMRVQMLAEKTFGAYPILHRPLLDWSRYLLNALSAPVNGMRNYPPQGAHSGRIDPIAPAFYHHRLGALLEDYEPLLGEYLRYVAAPNDHDHEEEYAGQDLYRGLGTTADKGTRPDLRSAKFTGYGCVLRAGVHTENELSLHVQQIDNGPNYRWGLAGEGGCGALYYYAQNRRLSYNRPEDIGDANMGDAEVGCNFGVLNGHEYKSIGRNELTEPMLDFGFAQYVCLLAGERSKAFYRSRSVILVGTDYIVINDNVRDSRTKGRFTWFAAKEEDFPKIVQLKPGAKPVPAPSCGSGGLGLAPLDADAHGYFNGTQIKPFGRCYDGFGDFLTLVTHRKINEDYCMYIHNTDEGARVEHSARLDYVFARNTRIDWQNDGAAFAGYEGVVLREGSALGKLAIFKGESAAVCGVRVAVTNGAAASAEISRNRVIGKIQCDNAATVTIQASDMDGAAFYLNGMVYDVTVSTDENGQTAVIQVEPGAYDYEWTKAPRTPLACVITGSRRLREGTRLLLDGDTGCDRYELQYSTDIGETWQAWPFEDGMVQAPEGVAKFHVRVRGVSGSNLGAWSADFPVYVSDAPPAPPKGLHADQDGDGVSLRWGMVLGACGYRVKADGCVVYEGEGTACRLTSVAASYTVSALDGFGESVASTPAAPQENWDPEPGKGFVRYAKSHEYGYDGYDPRDARDDKPLTAYPL